MSFSKLAWLTAVREDLRFGPSERLVVEHVGDTARQDGSRAFRTTFASAELCKALGRPAERKLRPEDLAKVNSADRRQLGLVDLLGVGDKTVERARATATKLGYWRVTREATRNRATEYQLLMPERE